MWKNDHMKNLREKFNKLSFNDWAYIIGNTTNAVRLAIGRLEEPMKIMGIDTYDITLAATPALAICTLYEYYDRHKKKKAIHKKSLSEPEI